MWIKVNQNVQEVQCVNFYPQGGSAIWGNSTFAPDDPPGVDHSFGQFVSFRSKDSPNPELTNLTVDEATNYILEHVPTTFQVSTAQCFDETLELI